MDFERKKRLKAISLVPMIDVLLCLLIFFMLSTQFIHWGSIQLLTEENHKNNTQIKSQLDKKTIYLSLLNNQQVQFLNQKVSLSNISQSVKTKYHNLENLIVEVKVASKANLQSTVDLVMSLKAIGLKNIKLENDHV
ncbi:MAG: biopolymer transporter ExbD [Gammaproteobacteria bacterium]|nr:MAG: biopolymer transporter ExbD [Gammaproteobacteria bacterium]UTW42763.1 biopolymer transporter ExbD [bacterium SCSIO 12844]